MARKTFKFDHAPNEEAKESAKQLRKVLARCFEDSIENRWSRLEDRLREGLALVVHIRTIEDSYRRDDG